MSRKEPFLSPSDKNPSERHKEYLGMDVPEGYFASSKQSILDMVTEGATDFSESHKEELGMGVPENYFATSKQSILDAIQAETSEVKETKVFYLRRSFQMAASIALLVALFIGYQFSDTTEDFEIASNDALIESLFVEEESMNDFVEELLVSEVVEEAEKEKELEDVLMNSLFVEDSLLEDYTKESLLENIIL